MPEKRKLETPLQPVSPAATAAGAATAPGNPAMSLGNAGPLAAAASPEPAAQAEGTQPPLTLGPPVVPEILTYPKASFWERLAAAFLDMILVGIFCVILHPIAFVVVLAYYSGLWAWKGTTIGGIVVGLKVVRADGKPLTLPVTLIRSLAAAFSVFVLFLGYLWIAWDPEKQGWHDKIAGTVVLKLPKGSPLICL
jgi:uncharacterized RDD family membrane protein YckC